MLTTFLCPTTMATKKNRPLISYDIQEGSKLETFLKIIQYIVLVLNATLGLFTTTNFNSDYLDSIQQEQSKTYKELAKKDFIFEINTSVKGN